MKRSPWRYVWTSRGIREKLLMTLGDPGHLSLDREYSGSRI